MKPFAEMTAARDYMSDHKRYSDNHEARVHRELTRFPMEVLMGDVHKLDIEIADALLQGKSETGMRLTDPNLLACPFIEIKCSMHS